MPEPFFGTAYGDVAGAVQRLDLDRRKSNIGAARPCKAIVHYAPKNS